MLITGAIEEQVYVEFLKNKRSGLPWSPPESPRCHRTRCVVCKGLGVIWETGNVCDGCVGLGLCPLCLKAKCKHSRESKK